MVQIVIDDQERRTLRERAQKLAAVLPEPSAEEFLSVLRFSLGEETYGIEYAHIREVLPLPPVTPVPCVPSFVRGIINVHGRIVSLLDMREILGLPDSGATSHSCAIILQSATIEFALVADEILGLTNVARSSIHASLPALAGVKADSLLGATAEGLVLLNAGKLLADKRLVVEETVEAAQ
jgi:purine-binding chemotaxis protein CheW